MINRDGSHGRQRPITVGRARDERGVARPGLSAADPEAAEPGRAGHSPIDALYSAVIDSLPETSVTVFDRDLRFRMAYGEALSFNGWTKEDLDGKTVGEVLPTSHLALLEPLFREALAGERASVEVPSLDGTRTLWTRVAPLEDDGVVVGGVAISVDITAPQAGRGGQPAAGGDRRAVPGRDRRHQSRRHDLRLERGRRAPHVLPSA